MPEKTGHPATVLEPGLQAGVRRILGARSARQTLAGLPPAHRPANLPEAYRMQRALTEAWGDRVTGWKVGATSPEVQALFGINEPVFGPIFTETVATSPAGLPEADFPHRLLESEFAFSFRTGLPPRPEPYRRTEVLAAVESVIPALEVVSPRFDRLMVDDIPLLVADFCANGGAILGTPCTAWQGLDLPAQPVRLLIDGVLCQEGTGALVLGDPSNVLVWLANALSAQGLAIAAGEFVLTGTMTGLHAPEPGQTAVADFGSLGIVEAVFG
ncbi:MAG: hypothetical protein U1E70_02250 [Acetobacteraceae bacterium]